MYIIYSYIYAVPRPSRGRGGHSVIPGVAFSWRWPLLLWSTGSRAHRLPQSPLIGSGAWRHMDPPGPGIKPASPTLAGKLLTSGQESPPSLLQMEVTMAWRSQSNACGQAVSEIVSETRTQTSDGKPHVCHRVALLQPEI